MRAVPIALKNGLLKPLAHEAASGADVIITMGWRRRLASDTGSPISRLRRPADLEGQEVSGILVIERGNRSAQFTVTVGTAISGDRRSPPPVPLPGASHSDALGGLTGLIPPVRHLLPRTVAVARTWHIQRRRPEQSARADAQAISAAGKGACR